MDGGLLWERDNCSAASAFFCAFVISRSGCRENLDVLVGPCDPSSLACFDVDTRVGSFDDISVCVGKRLERPERIIRVGDFYKGARRKLRAWWLRR